MFKIEIIFSKNMERIRFNLVLFMDDKKPNMTMYGEEVCSEFVWLPLDKQKENADKLANVTNKNKKAKR